MVVLSYILIIIDFVDIKTIWIWWNSYHVFCAITMYAWNSVINLDTVAWRRDFCMRQRLKAALIQGMAWCLFVADLLLGSVLAYYRMTSEWQWNFHPSTDMFIKQKRLNMYSVKWRPFRVGIHLLNQLFWRHCDVNCHAPLATHPAYRARNFFFQNQLQQLQQGVSHNVAFNSPPP